MNRSRRVNKILILACAALMLVLLAAGEAPGREPGATAGHTWRLEALQPDAGMAADAGRPLSGLGRASAGILKAHSLTIHAGGSSGACKAVAEKPLSFFSAEFRRILPSSHIHILYETFGAPAGCRAPPAFSRL